MRGSPTDDLPRWGSYEGGTRAYKGDPKHVVHEALVKLFNVPSRRGLLPPIDFVKARIIGYGAVQEVVDLCDEVNGLTREALERRLTYSQCSKLGPRDGERYQILLEKVEGTGEVETKNRCRLCPRNCTKTTTMPCISPQGPFWVVFRVFILVSLVQKCPNPLLANQGSLTGTRSSQVQS